MNDNKFGKKLQQLRKLKGFTQAILAEKIGIDEKHLSRIENGKYFPSYTTLNKILTVLNINIEEAGLDLNKVKINKNPIYLKAVHILNSAKNDDELACYLECLKCTQKAINL